MGILNGKTLKIDAWNPLNPNFDKFVGNVPDHYAWLKWNTSVTIIKLANDTMHYSQRKTSNGKKS
jgi:hypothetical protein